MIFFTKIALAAEVMLLTAWPSIGMNFEPTEVMTFTNYHARVGKAPFSPDGQYLITTTTGSGATVWNTQSGQVVHDLSGFLRDFGSVSFSQDGKRIIIVFKGEGIAMFLLENSHWLLNFKLHHGGHCRTILSHDEKLIASTSYSSSYIIEVFDAKTGQQLCALNGHTDLVISIAFSHDGKHIISASWDRTAKVWDILTAECLLDLTGHKDKIGEAVFSRYKDHIVTCSDDGTAIVWCAYTGQTLQVLQHGDQVPSAAISPDGRYVITASSKFVKIWETETGNLLFKIAGYSEDNPKPTAAFSPDGKSFIIGSGKQTTKMWILPPEDLLKPHTLKLTIFANFIREYLNSLGKDPASYQGFISFLTKKCGDNAKSYEKIIFDNLHTDMRTYLRALIKGRPD